MLYKPIGKDLLELLISLLAEQEGAKITYEIGERNETENT